MQTIVLTDNHILIFNRLLRIKYRLCLYNILVFLSRLLSNTVIMSQLNGRYFH